MVKDSEVIASKILNQISPWSQEVKASDLLICVASVLRTDVKNISKERTEEAVCEVRRTALTFVLSYFPSCRHQHPREFPRVPVHHV